MKNYKTNYVLKTLVFCFIALPNLLSSQIVKYKIYYDSTMNACDSINGSSFHLFEKDLLKKTGCRTFFYDKINKFDAVYYDSSDINNVRDSILVFHPNGKIRVTYNSINNNIIDSFKTFYENGNTKRIDVYEFGEFIKGKCFDIKGKKVKYHPYLIQTHYKGGEEALAEFIISKFKYPKELKKNGINGSVTLKFVVNTEGKVENIKVIEGDEPLFNLEAIRVVGLTKWVPGCRDGVYFKSYKTLPLALNVADE